MVIKTVQGIIGQPLQPLEDIHWSVHSAPPWETVQVTEFTHCQIKEQLLPSGYH